MRILAIDYGTKRIGLAISDPNGSMALALPLLEITDRDDLVDKLVLIIHEKRPDEVVVGLPINMDDTVGPSARAVLDFVEDLKGRVSVPIATWDERLTSEQAGDMIRDLNLTRKKHRRAVNTVAAQIILQNYLDSRRRSQNR